MELMRGYIIYNKDGKRLTRNLRWSDDENAGWLWTEGEVREITKISSGWKHKPAFYQYCALIKEEDGDVNVYEMEKPEEL